MSSGEHHIIPAGTYLKILMVLFVLTALTVLAAKPVSGVDFGFLNTAVALGIATLKAGFVLAIFMGLKYDKKLHLLIFLTGVFFLILLFALSWVDIISRVPLESTL